MENSYFSLDGKCTLFSNQDTIQIEPVKFDISALNNDNNNSGFIIDQNLTTSTLFAFN